MRGRYGTDHQDLPYVYEDPYISREDVYMYQYICRVQYPMVVCHNTGYSIDTGYHRTVYATVHGVAGMWWYVVCHGRYMIPWNGGTMVYSRTYHRCRVQYPMVWYATGHRVRYATGHGTAGMWYTGI